MGAIEHVLLQALSIGAAVQSFKVLDKISSVKMPPTRQIYKPDRVVVV